MATILHAAVLAILCVHFQVVRATGLLSPGLNIDPSNPKGNPPLSQVGALGVQWVRIEYKDSGSQPTQFGFYDPVIASYRSAGVRVLMILDYMSAPGAPSVSAPESAWDSFVPVFAARCSAVAGHYSSQVSAYEIWNEQDLSATGVPPSAYASLLKNAYSAIKAVSNATVVFGGLASGNPSYVSSVIQANGGRLYADGVGVHPYGQRPFPNWPNPTWGFGNLQDLLRNYLAVTPSLPLWITEVGTDDTSVQDTFPYEAFLSVNSSLVRQVPYLFWFCWSDAMVSPFGLVDVNGNPKGSFSSYQKWTHS